MGQIREKVVLRLLWREWASFRLRESYKAGLKRTKCCVISGATIELIFYYFSRVM